MRSRAIFFGEKAGDLAPLLDALAAHAWDLAPADALDARTAVVLLDGMQAGADAWIAQVRARAQPTAGVPILQWRGARMAGTSGPLPADGDATALIAAVETFTGALDDHDLRHPPFSPFYRLVRLLGTRDAVSMVDRLADTLRAALGDPDAAGTAHRLAGVAGAIGYSALAQAWGAADRAGAAALPAARTETQAALADIERGAAARYRPHAR